MTQYLVTVYHPENYNQAELLNDIALRQICTVKDEMITAGATFIFGGIRPSNTAKSIIS